MIFTYSVYILSLASLLFSKALASLICAALGEDYYAFLDWRNSEELLRMHRIRICKQLAFAIFTFRISKHVVKSSFVSFLLSAIVVVRFLTIQVRLAKMVRSLRQTHSPLIVTACVAISAVVLYLKMIIEVVLAAQYLARVSRRPSLKDMTTLTFGVLRLLEFR